MPTALYSIYATVGLHVTVPRMPVLELYESLISPDQCVIVLVWCATRLIFLYVLV